MSLSDPRDIAAVLLIDALFLLGIAVVAGVTWAAIRAWETRRWRHGPGDTEPPPPSPDHLRQLWPDAPSWPDTNHHTHRGDQ